MTTSKKDVVQAIIEVTGTSLKAVYGPAQSVWIDTIFLDVSKAERMLGFKVAIPLKEGLKRYYDWRQKRRSSQ